MEGRAYAILDLHNVGGRSIEPCSQWRSIFSSQRGSEQLQKKEARHGSRAGYMSFVLCILIGFHASLAVGDVCEPSDTDAALESMRAEMEATHRQILATAVQDAKKNLDTLTEQERALASTNNEVELGETRKALERARRELEQAIAKQSEFDSKEKVQKREDDLRRRLSAIGQSSADTLSAFDVKTVSGVVLPTVHIARAYAPMNINCSSLQSIKTDLRRATSALGMDISASVPESIPSLAQYGRQAVLQRDGGVLNINVNPFAGRDPESAAFDPIGKGKKHNPRNNSFDRQYISKAATPNELLAYWAFDLEARAIKTAVTGNSHAGLFAIYLGLGVDGPLVDRMDGDASDPGAGWTSLEAGTGVAFMNTGTYSTLFGVQSSHSYFPSVSAKWTIGLPGKFSFSLEYAKAYGGYGVPNIGEITMLIFGYNDAGTKGTVKK